VNRLIAGWVLAALLFVLVAHHKTLHLQFMKFWKHILVFYATFKLVSGQFQQYFMSAIAPIFFCAKKVQTSNVSTKKLLVKLSYEKPTRKMLAKLTPGRISTS
jgi:hypothetical protein